MFRFSCWIFSWNWKFQKKKIFQNSWYKFLAIYIEVRFTSPAPKFGWQALGGIFRVILSLICFCDFVNVTLGVLVVFSSWGWLVLVCIYYCCEGHEIFFFLLSWIIKLKVHSSRAAFKFRFQGTSSTRNYNPEHQNRFTSCSIIV